MAEPESELAKLRVPERTKEQKEEAARFDKETIGGPTLFVNRHSIQTYQENGFRITFAEQYSGDTEVTPSYRTAVFMHTHTAVLFAQALINILPLGSVTIPSTEDRATEPASPTIETP
jgi:hypothetical protein